MLSVCLQVRYIDGFLLLDLAVCVVGESRRLLLAGIIAAWSFSFLLVCLQVREIDGFLLLDLGVCVAGDSRRESLLLTGFSSLTFLGYHLLCHTILLVR